MRAILLVHLFLAATGGLPREAAAHDPLRAPSTMRLGEIVSRRDMTPDRPLSCIPGGVPRPVTATGSPPGTTAPYPLFAWPVESAANDGIVLGLYVDDDTSSGAFHDYQCSDGAYDGHLGTDFGIYSFRAMDRAQPVLAAASGTVVWKQDGAFDRNTSTPQDDGNYLGIDHGDGSHSWYFHVRRNSITVDVGESIVQGQLLAMVGSSGYSFGPHLHFEIGEYAPSWIARDPWNGPCNALPTLWISQEPYVGDDPLRIHDMGVTTEPAAGGNLESIPYALLIEGLSQPAVTGASEERIAVWVQFQGNIGDSMRIEVRRPNGSLFTWFDFTLAFKAYFDTGVWIVDWSGGVTPADYGTWTARVLVAGSPVMTEPFPVSGATQFGPRFSPLAGRSFRMSGDVQRDTLRVSSLGGPVSFSLIDAPSFVSLADSVLTIGAISNQPARSLYFQASATDGQAQRDTMWYHVVDPTKPLGSPVGVGPSPEGREAAPWLAPNLPNPFGQATTIRFSAGRARVMVSVHDLAGRTIRTLLEPASSSTFETGTIEWDGRDDHGRVVPSGMYVCRLIAGTEVRSRKMVLVR